MLQKCLIALSLCLSCLILPAAANAASCPQFLVIHNDRINSVSFPAGSYNIVNSGMSCAQTTKYMQQFLDKGLVAKGWTVKLLSKQRRRFTKLNTNPTVDFQATPVAAEANADDMTVMSRNIYLGADLIPLAVYGDDATKMDAFKHAASGVWNNVKATNFPLRAKALAKELNKTKPDILGLQEAAIWRKSSSGNGPANQVVYDYMKLLLAATKKAGTPYRLLIAQDEFDFTAPTDSGYKIRFTQRDAILVRTSSKLKFSNLSHGRFNNIFQAPTPAGMASSRRGWVAAEVQNGSKSFKVINTHLEAYGDAIRTSQAQQLLEEGCPDAGSIILLGDLNSDPQNLAAGGDAYRALHQSLSDTFPAPVPTSGQTALLRNPKSQLTEWIDHIMVRGPWTLKSTGVVGNKSSDRIFGLWPSDHAGVWAKLSLAN